MILSVNNNLFYIRLMFFKGIPNPAFEYQESVGSMDSIVSVDEKAPQSKKKKKKDSTLKIDV